VPGQETEGPRVSWFRIECSSSIDPIESLSGSSARGAIPCFWWDHVRSGMGASGIVLRSDQDTPPTLVVAANGREGSKPPGRLDRGGARHIIGGCRPVSSAKAAQLIAMQPVGVSRQAITIKDNIKAPVAAWQLPSHHLIVALSVRLASIRRSPAHRFTSMQSTVPFVIGTRGLHPDSEVPLRIIRTNR